MKHVKNNPPELCEKRVLIVDPWVPEGTQQPCLSPAKYERFFDDPKAKPMRLCGIHARQAKRNGFVVKLIGE